MKKILSIFSVFILSLSLSSFKFNEDKQNLDTPEMYNYELVDTVYLNNFIGSDYKHDIYKTDRFRKEINTRQITGWIKKADYLNMKIGYTKAIFGKINAKYIDDIEYGFDLKKIFNASRKVGYEKSYEYNEEAMIHCEWDITPNLPGTYLCIGLNVKYRVYEINNYKQQFVWFGQGDYVFESSMEVLVPEVDYISLNYMNEVDNTLHEYNV